MVHIGEGESSYFGCMRANRFIELFQQRIGRICLDDADSDGEIFQAGERGDRKRQAELGDLGGAGQSQTSKADEGGRSAWVVADAKEVDCEHFKVCNRDGQVSERIDSALGECSPGTNLANASRLRGVSVSSAVLLRAVSPAWPTTPSTIVFTSPSLNQSERLTACTAAGLARAVLSRPECSLDMGPKCL